MLTRNNREHFRSSLFAKVLTLLVTVAVFTTYFATPNFAATVTVVASGLHGPRGLNFAPDGSLYVVETAANGTPGPCGVAGDGSTRCFSSTGSVTRIDLLTNEAERVMTSLPSLISPSGDATAAFGVHDISFQGLGNAYLTCGLGGNPSLRSTYFGSDGELLARLGRFNPSHRLTFEADLGAYEVAEDPDGHAVPDSNPYGVLALPGKVIYADAGANAVNQVLADGTISTLAVFPDQVVARPDGSMVAVQAVPTTVAIGPDGDLYVGELTGAPFTVGAANVYRVPIDGGTPEVAYGGFTNIIDIAFADDGTLYVLEIARSGLSAVNIGRLLQITPDGTRTEILSPGQLRAPGGIAIGSDGALYVSNRSLSPIIGEVLRIDL